MQGTKLLIVWVMILFVWFVLGISYFILYEAYMIPLVEIFAHIDASYAAGDITHDPGNMCNQFKAYYGYSHIIIAVGTLIWGVLYSTKEEEHVYRM